MVVEAAKKDLLIRQQNTLREQDEKHRQQILLFEQERLQAEYDQLKKQLQHKTIEITNKAKENEDKNRLILTSKEKMESVQKKPNTSAKRWSELYKLLDACHELEDHAFEIQMDELH